MGRKAGILIAVYVAALAINLDVTIVTSPCPASRPSSTPAPAACSGSSTATASPSPPWCWPRAACPTARPASALLIGPAGFAAASVVGALVTSRGLIAARFGMGAFAALIFPTTLSIICNAFPDRKQRAAALGGWGAVVGVGVASGPVTGGAAAQALLLGQHLPGAGRRSRWSRPASPSCLVPESRDPAVPALDTTRPGRLDGDARAGSTYTVIEAPEARVGARLHPARVPGAAALVAVFVMVERARRSTRCSTSACSPTAGSAPRAARSP